MGTISQLALAVEIEPQALVTDKSANTCEVAQEIPLTKPFEGYSFLKKIWIDNEEGIDSVKLNVAYGHINKPANWNKMESYEMMPEWGTSPLCRTWALRIPTHYEGKDRYLLHYFFLIRDKNGNERVSANYAQLIVPKEIQFIDHSGAYTHVKLHWSLEDWSYPQDTEMELDFVEWGSDYSVSQSAYRKGDKNYEKGRAQIISKIPAPRLFKALIWAPMNEKVNYCFNLISADQNGKLSGKWDNNSGNNYVLTV